MQHPMLFVYISSVNIKMVKIPEIIGMLKIFERCEERNVGEGETPLNIPHL